MNWWTTVRNDPGGYQLITETLVFAIPVPTLLDTGAAVNAITEEMLVEIINSALQEGVKAQDPEYPVVQLERWQEKECVAGVAKDRPVKLISAVVLRVVLGTVGMAKARQGPQVLLRFKIFSKGACDWHGLIIGGRALDVPERGGLGLRVTQDAYAFDGPGALLPRLEEDLAPRNDNVYGYRMLMLRASVFDSDAEEDDEDAVPVARLGGVRRETRLSGDPLLYEGDSLVLEPDEGAWLPVRRASVSVGVTTGDCEVVLPAEGCASDVTPGLDEAAAIDVTRPLAVSYTHLTLPTNREV